MPRKAKNEDRLRSVVCKGVSPGVRDSAILLLGDLWRWKNKQARVAQLKRLDTPEGIRRLIHEAHAARRILDAILEPIARGDAGFFEEFARLIRGGLKTGEQVAFAVQDYAIEQLLADGVSGPSLVEYVAKVPGLEDVDESTVRKIAKQLGLTFRSQGRPKKSGKKSKRRPG